MVDGGGHVHVKDVRQQDQEIGRGDGECRHQAQRDQPSG